MRAARCRSTPRLADATAARFVPDVLADVESGDALEGARRREDAAAGEKFLEPRGRWRQAERHRQRQGGGGHVHAGVEFSVVEVQEGDLIVERPSPPRARIPGRRGEGALVAVQVGFGLLHELVEQTPEPAAG